MNYSFCSVGFEADKDDETPLKSGYVRLYDFLHGYEDITLEEWEEYKEALVNDELHNILMEELTKAINKEMIEKIYSSAIKT